jgi:hypothetical protein
MIRKKMSCLAVLATASMAFGQFAPMAPAPDVTNAVYEELNLATFDVQNLDLPQGLTEGFAVRVNLGGKDHTLLLRQHSVRSDDYQLLVDDGNMLMAAQPGPVTTYRGHVIGVGDSGVAASLVDGQLKAVIDLADDQGLWFVQPLSDALPNAGHLEHVVYYGPDSLGDEWRCGYEDLEDFADHADHNHGSNFGPKTPGNDLAQIAFDADYEFYQKNGSSVPNTEADIEGVLNSMDFIYDRDTQINYTITTIIVRSNPNDPYTSTDAVTLLNQFRSHWNTSQGSIQRDLAHLMTGKNIQGGTIGIAWLGVVCNRNQAYGLSESRFTNNFNQRVALTAHEAGHNWNATHCDSDGFNCKIMCATLNGCGGIGLPNFGDSATAEIRNFANSRTCLDIVPDENTGIDHQLVEVPISPDAIADDPALGSAKTFDLQVIITEDDDWTATGATAVSDGVIYQHPTADGDVPQTTFWNVFPSLEHDTFWSARDFAAPGFAEGPFINISDWNASWFDTVDTGNGTYTIARITVTSGSTLTVSGDSTAKNSGGQLNPFEFTVDFVFSGLSFSLVEVPISGDAISDDPALGNAQTFDLQVNVTSADDWTAAEVTAAIDGTFYQHPVADADTPQPTFWAAFPSLEYDSFFSGRDFAAPGFAEGPFNTDSQIEASWFDTVDTGNGTYTLARFTVTSGTTLTVNGNATGKNTGGILQPFGFSVDIDLTPPCEGDLNGDGQRDLADLGILLASFEVDDGGDINGDGVTDLADLGALLAVFDVPCP